MYTGPERRTNGLKAAVLEERIDALIQSFDEFKMETREYKEKTQALGDLLVTKIGDINERCAVRMGTCEQFKIHLIEHSKKKDWWKDKKAQIVTLLISSLISNFFGFWVGIQLTKYKDEYERENKPKTIAPYSEQEYKY